MHFIYLANVLFALVSDFPSLFPPTQQEGSMEMCSLSVTRTPPLTASVIAAASATPSAWRTKVMLPSTPVLCNCTCHCFNTWVCVYVLAVLQVGGVVFFLFFFICVCCQSSIEWRHSSGKCWFTTPGCVARWRVQRGRSPGGFPVQVEGVHRQHGGQEVTAAASCAAFLCVIWNKRRN